MPSSAPRCGQTWWDRDYKDATNDETDVYDKGAPDYQTGEKKNRKWQIICAGVEALIKQENLDENDVVLWTDWQSIHQEDKKEKGKGVMSLIKYTTLCRYMLVPTEETQLTGHAATFPEEIPGYGGRGWCRGEYFIFSLWAEMMGRVVQLFAIKSDGSLHHYPEVKVEGAQYMPSGGALSNPNDKATVQGLEDTMIAAYGQSLIVNKCKAAGKGEEVDLSKKMIRAVHVDTLAQTADEYNVASINLQTNQLGVDGAACLAKVLKNKMKTVTTLK